MIGNLPGIINRNNDSLEAEFGSLFYYSDASVKKSPVLKVDVSSNNISAQVGYFRNINIGGRTIDASLATKYVQLDSSVRNLDDRVTALEESNTGTLNSGTYGVSSSSVGGYDMSSFWKNRNASLGGVMVENLIFERPYCIKDGVVIPLYVGTTEIAGRVYSTVYYDHIDETGNVWRIYAPIQTALDGNTVILAGNPGRVKLNVSK
jgi:hypothetical protein